MNHFYVWPVKRVKQILVILIAAFATASYFFIQNTAAFPVFSTDTGPKVIYKGEKNTKEVALTFNISWGDEKAVPILNTLKDNGIKNATFFLSASWAEKHPDIVKQIKKDGHQIGSLGFAYENYTTMTKEEIKQDIVKAQNVFQKLDIEDVQLLRAPTGQFNEEALKVATQYGYTLIHYSINSNDWTNPGIDKIIENVNHSLSSGDIILLHASDSAKQTVEALPQIIKNIKSAHLKNVTVGELVSNTDVRSTEVK